MKSHKSDAHLVVLGPKTNSWAWGIEQANRLIKLGEEVIVLDLGASLVSRGDNARGHFQRDFIDGTKVSFLEWRSIMTLPTRKKIIFEVGEWLRELREIERWDLETFYDLPLGRILMSNFARTAGTNEFPLNLIPWDSQLKIASQAVNAWRAYESLDLEFSRVSVANGRTPVEAGVLFGARKEKKETFVLEAGSESDKWSIWKNSPHFAPDWWNLLEEMRLARCSSNFISITDDYWSKRLMGWDSISRRDWSSEFDTGKLPQSLPTNFVSYFCNSDHETPALPDFECFNFGFQSQQLAARKLAEICQSLHVPLIIKRHPNSLAADGTDREQSKWVWVINNPAVIYIGPTDRVDTYELISRSTAVVTFRSSVGVEAAALGIPSRAMGPARWAYTEETRIWFADEVHKFIKNPTVLKNSPHLEWGYLASTFGSKLEIFHDVTGRYASVGATKYFSSDSYRGVIGRLLEKVFRRVGTTRFKWPRVCYLN